MTTPLPTVCFFQAYNRDYIRTETLLEGLRDNGVPVVLCQANRKGPLRYPLALWKLLCGIGRSDVVLANFRSFEILWLLRLLGGGLVPARRPAGPAPLLSRPVERPPGRPGADGHRDAPRLLHPHLRHSAGEDHQRLHLLRGTAVPAPPGTAEKRTGDHGLLVGQRHPPPGAGRD